MDYVLWKMTWANFVMVMGGIPDESTEPSKSVEKIEVMNAADAF